MAQTIRTTRRSLIVGAAGSGLGAHAVGATGAGAIGPKAGRAPVDGLEVYYELHGGPLGAGVEPFVLLHGGAMAIETSFASRWLPKLLARIDRPVVAIDQQGHGHTAARPGPFRLERMVADTMRVLDHLNVRRAIFLGHSLGGMISLGAAIARPDRVRACILVSSGYRLDGMLPDIAAVQTNPNHPVAAEVAALFPTQQDFGQWVDHYNRVAPDPRAFQDVLGRLNAMLGAWTGWSEAQLRAVKAPTMLICGDNDFMRLEHMAEMKRLIPGAHLAILPGTTHMNILDRGDWIVPLIEARLRS